MVSKLSQFIHSPHESHLVAAKRILRYLNGTLGRGILFRKSPFASIQLIAYSDSDWTGTPLDRCSTTDYVIFKGSNPISWRAKKQTTVSISWGAKKQTTVSISSTEAEYKVLVSTAVEIYWIRQILHDFHLDVAEPPFLLCDNISDI